jgi:hypothetical protein
MDETDDRPESEPGILELKAGEMPDLGDLLVRMTIEMQAQFEAFRQMRESAEAILAGSPDDAGAKLARADIKAAADAMSLMIRTLEKIEALQRSMAHAEERAMEERLQEEGYDDAKAQLLALVEARAAEIAAQSMARSRAGDDGPGLAPASGQAAAGPPPLPGPTAQSRAQRQGRSIPGPAATSETARAHHDVRRGHLGAQGRHDSHQ